jgi:hypothetical protein
VRVPIVPAAVLFDLWLGDARLRPDAQTGWDACAAASTHPPAQGNAGAGLGATVGKLWGVDRAMKGGLGTASVRVGALTVGAIAAVNAAGDVLAPDGQVLAGARDAAGTGLRRSTASLLAGDLPPRMAAGVATTLAVVATDARLDKAQVNKLARLAHHGMSRAVDPITMSDGDTVFTLATGRGGPSGDPPDLGLLGALAAEALRRAIVTPCWRPRGWRALTCRPHATGSGAEGDLRQRLTAGAGVRPGSTAVDQALGCRPSSPLLAHSPGATASARPTWRRGQQGQARVARAIGPARHGSARFALWCAAGSTRLPPWRHACPEASARARWAPGACPPSPSSPRPASGYDWRASASSTPASARPAWCPSR